MRVGALWDHLNEDGYFFGISEGGYSFESPH